MKSPYALGNGSGFYLQDFDLSTAFSLEHVMLGLFSLVNNLCEQEEAVIYCMNLSLTQVRYTETLESKASGFQGVRISRRRPRHER